MATQDIKYPEMGAAEDFEAWDLYRKLAPSDLHALLTILEHDLEYANDHLDRLKEAEQGWNDELREAIDSGDEERKASIQGRREAGYAILDRQLDAWSDKKARATAITNLLRYRLTSPNDAAPRWDDLGKEEKALMEQYAHDGRVTGKHLESRMVARYWEIIESTDNPDPVTARGSVLQEFENPISDRHFQRYLQNNPRP